MEILSVNQKDVIFISPANPEDNGFYPMNEWIEENG